MEAALIVGIVAAFLGQQGRRDALRQMWIGVAVAVAICIAIGVALQLISEDLPQRQQEGLETVVGAIAVVMVTYMVLWMRRHSRDLKGDLEAAAGSALARGSSRALVVMAFLAVLREGFETVVFLLATFHASGDATASWLGAVLGILLAVVLGYGIYQGGVRINLSRFFRITGIVLVVIAAGLVMTAVPHRQRGRLGQLRPDTGARPVLARPDRHPAVVVRHRRLRHPALSDVDRADRLAGLPGADAHHHALAPSRPKVASARAGDRGRRLPDLCPSRRTTIRTSTTRSDPRWHQPSPMTRDRDA